MHRIARRVKRLRPQEPGTAARLVAQERVCLAWLLGRDTLRRPGRAQATATPLAESYLGGRPRGIPGSNHFDLLSQIWVFLLIRHQVSRSAAKLRGVGVSIVQRCGLDVDTWV